MKNDIFDKIWKRMDDHYKKKIESYMKTFATRKKNRKILYESTKTAMFRESIQCVKSLESYTRAFLLRIKVDEHLGNVRKVQNYIRMSKIRTKYNSLKDHVIKIQRAWRKY